MNGAAEGAGPRAPGRGIVGKRKSEGPPRSLPPPRGYLGRCYRPRAGPAERSSLRTTWLAPP
ncbi:hypothetical protein Celaphus_00007000 [Cervus elaphus hippelaphus]|uniref:Uncharacterized protein n=1 Tax=Cervus elaphus hippelaphus TaxID=46360 RepID=A0A212CZG3_CEREH|nr:hypothetical protein Celaphus_00007000 [Cervus elaphus hippelaphus]